MKVEPLKKTKGSYTKDIGYLASTALGNFVSVKRAGAEAITEGRSDGTCTGPGDAPASSPEKEPKSAEGANSGGCGPTDGECVEGAATAFSGVVSDTEGEPLEDTPFINCELVVSASGVCIVKGFGKPSDRADTDVNEKTIV